MKTFEVIPSVCKEDGSKWEGKVTLRKFSFDEKFQFIQGMDVDIKNDGTVETYKTGDQIERVRKMVSMSSKFYVSVDLKNKETGDLITSFEDMTFEDELHNTLIELASKLMEGFRVGNA